MQTLSDVHDSLSLRHLLNADTASAQRPQTLDKLGVYPRLAFLCEVPTFLHLQKPRRKVILNLILSSGVLLLRSLQKAGGSKCQAVTPPTSSEIQHQKSPAPLCSLVYTAADPTERLIVGRGFLHGQAFEP